MNRASRPERGRCPNPMCRLIMPISGFDALGRRLKRPCWEDQPMLVMPGYKRADATQCPKCGGIAGWETDWPKETTAVRHFQRYTHEQRADHAASHRLGHRQRQAVGEYFWIHPKVPGVAFPSKKLANAAAARVRVSTSRQKI